MDYAEIINLLWEKKIDFLKLMQVANGYEKEKKYALAAVLYQTWIAQNDSPFNSAAYYNIGVIHFTLGNYKKAEECYKNVKSLNPGLLEARLNLGLTLEQQGFLEAACEEWKQIEACADVANEDQKKSIILSFNHLARLLETRKIYDQANFYLNKSLELDPNQTDVLHHLTFVRARQCLWPVYQAPEGVDLQLMKDSTSALAMIALSDDPQMQLDAATRYASKKAPLEENLLSEKQNYGHEKIRIGYCSSDFSLHPVSMLTVELFELHDRERFEIYGFCWSPQDGSQLRERVIQSFDHYVPIGALDEEAAAKKIRDLEIDILIDLQGQTAGARMKMLAWKPAPIQITYLGLPATTGMSSIDYVIADKYLIPEESAHFYSEKMIYMPDVYQVSDRQRVSAKALTKKEYGLPARGFIFCAFNNNYKYTLEVFTCWMNILKRVPQSVLWLLEDNPIAKINLQLQAQEQGVDPQRLIFAGRVLPADYLARYQVADLFLDTFPFNAGTTANDALWMGLPLLTMSGRAFASRMAGALLTAAGIPELITENLKDYEDKAVSLAKDPKKVKNLRKTINDLKNKGVLFDTPKFTRNLEDILTTLVDDLPKAASQAVPQSKIENQFQINSLMDAIQAAESKVAANDLVAAAGCYQEYLKKIGYAAAEWMAHFNYAIILHNMHDHEMAKRQFEITLIKNPSWEAAKIGVEKSTAALSA